MKLKLITVALAITATPVLAAMGTTDIPTFAGQAAAPAAANTPLPKSPEEWLTRMTDFSRNLSAFKDPKAFVPWANAVTEPSLYVAMMNGLMDPGGWLNMLNSAAQPNAVRNLAQFADPGVYLKWAAATGDPNFYTALLTQLSDPAKLIRWVTLPADPRMWNTLLSTLNPNTYIRWGLSGMDPRAWNLAATVANPALYTGMLGAVVNPNSYGPGTSNWLTWAPQPPVQGAGSFSMWDPVATLGNLSGLIPGINLSALPTLPNIGLPTLPQTTSALSSAPLYPQATPPANPVETVKIATVVPVVAQPEPAKAFVQPAAPVAVEAAKAVAAVPAAIFAAPVVAAAPKPTVVVPPAAVIAERPAVVVTPAPAVVAAPAVVVAAKPAVVVTPVPAVVAVPAEVIATHPATPVSAPVAAAKQAPTSSKVILAGDALFQLGKSGIKDLSRDGKTRLDEVIAKIKAMGSVEQIRVVGHADPTGSAKTNRMLSEMRAKSVRSYLVAKGIKPGVILVSGMGDTQPVAQCDKILPKPALRDCHAPNRRVEIDILGTAK